jgi:hypothetical protein
MFLFLAILMVLLTHLMPIGLLMMALAVAVLAGLALTRPRHVTTSAQVSPLPTDETDDRPADRRDDAPAVPARAPVTVPAARTGADRTPSTPEPHRELVGADRR